MYSKKLSFGLSLVVASGVLLFTHQASAFPFHFSWHMDADDTRAGAGGIYGTGGAQDHGIKCSHCHIDNGRAGEHDADIEVTASPPFGSVGGEDAYSPGQPYDITIRMLGNDLNATPSPNLSHNGMVATVEDASGQLAGRFRADAGQDSRPGMCPSANPYPINSDAPAGRTTFMYGDCHAVLPLGHLGLTEWRFQWTAPAAGAGDLTLFVGLVDGDLQEDSSLDDDVAERAIPLHEGS